MASLGQCRALAGCKAFTGVRPSQRVVVSNGAKATMKRNESYMVEVQVGDQEPEDLAVRRYMKLVMQSRVVEKLRALRTKETPLQKYKRETKERHELRKANFVEPTWTELYGEEMTRPFDEFFKGGQEDLDDSLVAFDPATLVAYAGDDYGVADNGAYSNAPGAWGAYMDDPQQRGGYMTSPNAGGYMNQGNMNQQAYQPYQTYAPGAGQQGGGAYQQGGGGGYMM